MSVVLIDAGSNLNDDDLSLLRALYEAGIPAQVLLSKADLLKSDDRQRVLLYVREQLQRELNLDLTVHPVSIVGQDAALLDDWFEREIEPLWERHRTLVEKSLHRKIAGLRESIIAVLKTLLAKRRGTYPRSYDGRELKMVERLLDDADAAIQRAETRRRDWWADAMALVTVILQDAAKALVESSRKQEKGTGTFCAKHPKGRSGKRCLSPFPAPLCKLSNRSLYKLGRWRGKPLSTYSEL